MLKNNQIIQFHGNTAKVKNVRTPKDRVTAGGEQVYLYDIEIIEGDLKGTQYDGGPYSFRKSDFK